MKQATGSILCALILLLVPCTGCQIKHISASSPVPDRHTLVIGRTTYGQVLERYGPPGFVGSLAFGGFAMLYESMSVQESKLGFSTQGRTFGQSGGRRQYHFCGLMFDEDGILYDTILQRTDLDLGDELLLGSESNAGGFGKRDWGAGATANLWGARGLLPLPKLLNRQSGGIEVGMRGMELFDQPLDCGQHTLERPTPLPLPKGPF